MGATTLAASALLLQWDKPNYTGWLKC
jgi:hypothetical protein